MDKKIDTSKIAFKSHISGIIRAMVVGILVIMQIVFIVALGLSLTSYSVYFYLMFQLASFGVILSLLNQDKTISYKITWVFIVLLIPLSGHIMYMLWGTPNTNKKIEERILAKIKHGYSYLKHDQSIREQFYLEYPNEKKMSDFMSYENFPLFANNDIKYYSMGEHYFDAIFEDLKKAENFILINFFIIAEGVLWSEMKSILKEKKKQGVEIKILYDDFGTMFRTPKYLQDELKSYGFEVRVFNPIHRYLDKLYMNYRSHQKIVIVDGNIGYTGGINLADEYANIYPRFGKWKDTGIRIEGDAVWGLTVTFLQMWDISSNDRYNFSYEKYKPTKEFLKNNNYCHVLSDGPANDPENPIVNTYMQVISSSKEFLYITTPYLILDDAMCNELIRTAKSGVDVRIITPGIPDKKTVKLLTEYNYGPLLKSGIRIYEYTPGFMHAKMIVTENCAIVGTVNMDYRSFYLHYECIVWMCVKSVIEEIKKDILSCIDESAEVSYYQWKKRPIAVKLFQLIFNIFQTMF